MKTNLKLSLLIAIFLAAFIACNEFDQTAYKTLDTARVTYNQSMAALQQMQQDGQLSADQVEQATKAGNIYYSAYQVAKSAYLVYHNNPTLENQQQVNALMAEAMQKLLELTQLISLFQGEMI